MLNHFSKPSCTMVSDAAVDAAGGRVIAGSSSIQLAVSVMDARCVIMMTAAVTHDSCSHHSTTTLHSAYHQGAVILEKGIVLLSH